MKHFYPFLLSVFTALVLFGCGGSGGGSVPTTGQITLIADFQDPTRAVPGYASSLKVTVIPPTGVELSPALAAEHTLTRQAATKELKGLPANESPYILRMEAMTDGVVVGTALRSVFVTGGMSGQLDVSANMTSEVASVMVEGPQTVVIGGAIQFTAYAQNQGGQTLFSGEGFEWSSNNPLVAIVEADTGMVFPRDIGSAVLTAKLKGTTKSATHTVSVQSTDEESIDISPPSGSLLVGNTLQFTATVNGIENQGVTWSVEQINGGTIDASGLYTAPMSSGTFTVKATSQQDPSISKTATVNVSMSGNWTVVELHPFGATNSVARGTDGAQQVGIVRFDGGSWKAALWTGSSASYIDLQPPNFLTSQANNVQSGVQVGNLKAVALEGQATIWLGSAAQRASLHPSFAVESQVEAVDGNQQGGSVFFDGHYEASLWSGSAVTWTSLHPPAAINSWVYGMHGGQQVGQAQLPDEIYHASLWNGSAGTWVSLNPPGAALGRAYAVHDGKQVGYIQIGSVLEASLWSGSAASRVSLHPTGNSTSVAHDVHGAQQVGYVKGTSTGNKDHAALWSGTAASLIDLHQFLPSRFSESRAEGIWQGGGRTYIVGYATDRTAHPSGHTEAVMWVRGQ